MSRYRIPFILFAGIAGTILILLSCGQDSAQVASTRTDETQGLKDQLQESGLTIRKLQQENEQLKNELIAVTKELVRIKVERDVLKLELGPRRKKTSMLKTGPTDKP